MSEHVEVVAFDHDSGSQRLVAIVSVVDGRAEVDVRDDLFEGGVPDELLDPVTGCIVSRDAGVAFLGLLSHRFRGSYIVATVPHACGSSDCMREVASA